MRKREGGVFKGGGELILQCTLWVREKIEKRKDRKKKHCGYAKLSTKASRVSSGIEGESTI